MRSDLFMLVYIYVTYLTYIHCEYIIYLYAYIYCYSCRSLFTKF